MAGTTNIVVEAIQLAYHMLVFDTLVASERASCTADIGERIVVPVTENRVRVNHFVAGCIRLVGTLDQGIVGVVSTGEVTAILAPQIGPARKVRRIP